MTFNFPDIETRDVRVIVEFHGGQFDGTATAERLVPSIEIHSDDDLSAGVAIAAFALTQGQVGNEFDLPSVPDATRQVVRESGWAAILAHRYRVTDRLDAPGEILLRVECVQ